MSITITITAETGEDLRRQLLDMLVERHATAIVGQLAGGVPLMPTAAERRKAEAQAILRDAKPPEKPVQGDLAKVASKASPAKKTPVRAPVTEPEDVSPEVEDTVDPTPEPNGLGTADLIDLKAKTLETLQQAYADGKVKQVRSLLASHGKGAKTFREIEAEAFPGIAVAIQGGALA